MTTPPKPPPGYYQDPDGLLQERSWDGNQWTETTCQPAVDVAGFVFAWTPSTTVAVNPHPRSKTLLSYNLFESSWFRVFGQRKNLEADGVQHPSTPPPSHPRIEQKSALCAVAVNGVVSLNPFEYS